MSRTKNNSGFPRADKSFSAKSPWRTLKYARGITPTENELLSFGFRRALEMGGWKSAQMVRRRYAHLAPEDLAHRSKSSMLRLRGTNASQTAGEHSGTSAQIERNTLIRQ